MPFTFYNGTISTSAASAASVIQETKLASGIYCLIDYTKGNESSLDLTFATNNDDSLVSASYYNITERISGVATTYSESITASGKYSIHMDSPESSDKMKVSLVLNGGSTGDVKLFIATDNKYM